MKVMKVLIADAHQGTREKIRDAVLLFAPNSEILFGETGDDVMDTITDDDLFDVIIISNQLEGVFGTNLLQAIMFTSQAKTLFHSTHGLGYMEIAAGRGEMIDLAEHAKQFNFATFKIKDRDFSYIAEFLRDIIID
jgi:DNA-binding LytR/AlgR family response regulator